MQSVGPAVQQLLQWVFAYQCEECNPSPATHPVCCALCGKVEVAAAATSLQLLKSLYITYYNHDHLQPTWCAALCVEVAAAATSLQPLKSLINVFTRISTGNPPGVLHSETPA
jgi:hypothetical protein